MFLHNMIPLPDGTRQRWGKGHPANWLRCLSSEDRVRWARLSTRTANALVNNRSFNLDEVLALPDSTILVIDGLGRVGLKELRALEGEESAPTFVLSWHGHSHTFAAQDVEQAKHIASVVLDVVEKVTGKPAAHVQLEEMRLTPSTFTLAGT